MNDKLNQFFWQIPHSNIEVKSNSFRLNFEVVFDGKSIKFSQIKGGNLKTDVNILLNSLKRCDKMDIIRCEYSFGIDGI